jgi:hypothetical protein
VFHGFAAETAIKNDWTNRPPGQAGRFFFAFAVVSG